jgi:integrase/recombinase XerD
MKTLNQYLDDYLKLRRQLGYKMQSVEIMLRNFLFFSRQEGAEVIRVKMALRWATRSKAKPMLSAHRLGAVRRFAQYVRAYDPRTEVPAQRLLPYCYRRRDPCHYTDDNVLQLIKAARQIDPDNAIKGHTFGTVLCWDCWP